MSEALTTNKVMVTAAAAVVNAAAVQAVIPTMVAVPAASTIVEAVRPAVTAALSSVHVTDTAAVPTAGLPNVIANPYKTIKAVPGWIVIRTCPGSTAEFPDTDDAWMRTRASPSPTRRAKVTRAIDRHSRPRSKGCCCCRCRCRCFPCRRTVTIEEEQ